MSYTARVTCMGEVAEEEEFETREEARAWLMEWENDCKTGAEVLELSGEDFIDPDEYEYEIL